PNYELSKMTARSAGFDLRADISLPRYINPSQRMLIPTGLKLEIPSGWEGQVRPRSGLALKEGLTVLNTPGTIDSDYRGEVGVILINTSRETVVINPNDRIAQILFARVPNVCFKEVENLEETDRGEGGFGSTGKS